MHDLQNFMMGDRHTFGLFVDIGLNIQSTVPFNNCSHEEKLVILLGLYVKLHGLEPNSVELCSMLPFALTLTRFAAASIPCHNPDAIIPVCCCS